MAEFPGAPHDAGAADEDKHVRRVVKCAQDRLQTGKMPAAAAGLEQDVPPIGMLKRTAGNAEITTCDKMKIDGNADQALIERSQKSRLFGQCAALRTTLWTGGTVGPVGSVQRTAATCGDPTSQTAQTVTTTDTVMHADHNTVDKSAAAACELVTRVITRFIPVFATAPATNSPEVKAHVVDVRIIFGHDISGTDRSDRKRGR